MLTAAGGKLREAAAEMLAGDKDLSDAAFAYRHVLSLIDSIGGKEEPKVEIGGDKAER